MQIGTINTTEATVVTTIMMAVRDALLPFPTKINQGKILN
jgi:hypothetical protein